MGGTVQSTEEDDEVKTQVLHPKRRKSRNSETIFIERKIEWKTIFGNDRHWIPRHKFLQNNTLTYCWEQNIQPGS